MANALKDIGRSEVLSHPLGRGLVNAVVFVALLCAIDLFRLGALRDHFEIYALCLVAAALLFVDVIDSASIKRAESRPWSSDGWMYAYSVGAGWGVPMLLILWRPEAPAWLNTLAWGGAGIVFGLVMNHLFRVDRPDYLRRAGGLEATKEAYEGSISVIDQRFGRVFYYGWPFVALSLMALLSTGRDLSAYQQLVIGYQSVLLFSLNPRNSTKSIFASPRVFGCVALISAIIATYLTTMP